MIELPTAPWMSVKDIATIEAVLGMYPMQCYEYGSGGSTIYFKDKCKSWQSVESDLDWAHAVSEAGGNVRLEQDPENYVKLPHQKFDFILVDGKLRGSCLLEASRTNAITFCHDARREAYLPYAMKFLITRKVADDLLVMTNKLDNKLMDILKKFDLRSPYSKSFPWDPIHRSLYVEKCGFSKK